MFIKDKHIFQTHNQNLFSFCINCKQNYNYLYLNYLVRIDILCSLRRNLDTIRIRLYFLTIRNSFNTINNLIKEDHCMFCNQSCIYYRSDLKYLNNIPTHIHKNHLSIWIEINFQIQNTNFDYPDCKMNIMIGHKERKYFNYSMYNHLNKCKFSSMISNFKYSK